MTLVHSNKTNRGDLARLHSEMDDLFDSFFSGLDKPFFGIRLGLRSILLKRKVNLW